MTIDDANRILGANRGGDAGSQHQGGEQQQQTQTPATQPALPAEPQNVETRGGNPNIETKDG